MTERPDTPSPDPHPPWYHGVTPYQWMVLAIASIGWVFDVFEGQLFNLTRADMLSELFGVESSNPSVKHYGDVILGIFLLGGTAGGLVFGSLADRLGRRPAMVLSILMYSVFSGLTYFADTWWQVAVLRFLVAMGVGGEWAVAASLVAETFSVRARAHAAGIFHASSVIGTWGATLTSLAVGDNWRWAYVIGVAPALLTLWVRASVRESESWSEAEARSRTDRSVRLGSLRELLTNPRWAARAVLGTLLASIGLATFWAVTVAGQDLARLVLLEAGTPAGDANRHARFAYGVVQTAGGGVGLLVFAPLCARIGRRRAFAIMHVAAFAIVPLTCYGPSTYAQLMVILPVFGFLTLGMHAGYAVYFPELFPTHLRATGTGFCFNVGRTIAAPMLFFSGWLKSQPGVDLRLAITGLATLFLLGLACIAFMPETRGQALPE